MEFLLATKAVRQTGRNDGLLKISFPTELVSDRHALTP